MEWTIVISPSMMAKGTSSWVGKHRNDTIKDMNYYASLGWEPWWVFIDEHFTSRWLTRIEKGIIYKLESHREALQSTGFRTQLAGRKDRCRMQL